MDFASPVNASQLRSSFDTASLSGQGSPLLRNPDNSGSLLDISVSKASQSSLVFIDAGITDYQSLKAGVSADAEVYVLDSKQDAIAQITQTLLTKEGISSVHIVSHGEAGGLDFGSSMLNLADMPKYAAQLQSWSNALTDDADILLYGCNVAEGELGKAFVSILSQLTGADVAASTNLTGNSALGGDWTLEVNTGQIESGSAFQSKTTANYQSILLIGPDAAGYVAGSTAFDSSLNLVPGATDVVSLTTLASIDDSPQEAIDLGSNTFRFYGQTYTGANQLFVSDNGMINFGSGNSTFRNDGMGSGSALTQAAIGIVWDDWYTANNNAPDDLVLYQFQDTNSDGTQDRLVIEWNDVRHFSFRDTTNPAQAATFQMILELNTGTTNGNIIFNYTDLNIPGTPVDEAGSATVGIKDVGNSSPTNLIISQNTTSSPYVGTGRAILITGRTPILDLNGDLSQSTSGISNTVVFNQGDGPVSLVDSNVSLFDPDSTTLSSATITLTNQLNGTSEVLAANTTGTNITASYDSSTGILTLSGSDTAANYQQVLSTVSYNNTVSIPNSTSRIVTFLTSDGTNTSPLATTTIAMNAPTVDLNGSSSGLNYTAYLPSSTAVPVVNPTTLTVSDVDNTNLTAATVTITNLRNGASEVLAANTAGTNITASYDPTTGVMTLSGSDTVAMYQQVLRSVTYNNTATTGRDTRDRLITFVANDGSNNGPVATTTLRYGNPPATATPTITTNTITIGEGSTVILSSSNLNTSDNDSTPAELTYTVTTVTSGRFEFISSSGVAITSFTQDQINSGQVQFVHDGSESAPTYTLMVNDGTNTSGSSTVTIPSNGFTNTNDAPTISINTLTISEGSSVVLSSSNISAADPDNNPSQLTYTATGITNGRFEFVTNTGVAITSFTQAQINNSQVRFVHDGSGNAPTYSLTVNDGTVSSTASAVTIPSGGFTNVNDAPTFTKGTNVSVTAGIGAQSIANWATGFNPGSIEESSQTLVGYTISSNEHPELFTVAPAISSNGTLTFTPVASINQPTTVTIGVKAQDNGGTANGGVDTSAEQTFTITINPLQLNITPTTVNLNEGDSGTTAYTFTVNLSGPSTQPVTVQYSTVDGTAKVSGGDYQSMTNQLLTFDPGETQKTITILVSGDNQYEADENFQVALNTPTGAILGTSSATGIVLNDDAKPSITIGNTSVLEGNSGTTALTFTVRLSNPSDQAVTVDYNVVGGSATLANSDYQALASNTLTFATGQTEQTLTINVQGDAQVEANETVRLQLSNPSSNATITNTTAVGTIVNDDSAVNYSDFDGDGNPDFLWHNKQTGDVGIWQMNGTSIGNSLVIGTADPLWDAQATADFNGDGKTDILWRNRQTGDVGIWQMNGTSLSSAFSVAPADLSWKVEGLADFDGDHKVDILWRNVVNGDVGIWKMNGSAFGSASLVSPADLSWQIEGLADFDNDGKVDILWRHRFTGDVGVWQMNGLSLNTPQLISAADTNWTIEGLADFDGDGKVDILWRNRQTSEVGLWQMNGTSRGSAMLLETAAANWELEGLLDLNNDGKTDILWRNQDSGEIGAWKMNGTTQDQALVIGPASLEWELENFQVS